MKIDFRVPIAFIKKDFISERSYKFNFLLQAIGILFSTLTFYFLSKLLGQNINSHIQPYGGDYFSFMLIGLAVSNYLHVSLQGFSSTIRESQLMGILEILLVTDTKLSVILISSLLYKFLFTSIRIMVYILFGVLFFSMNISHANYFAAVIIIMLTIISFSCIGIISASFIMIFKRGDPISWLFNSLSWLIGGVYYPISILPPWLQKVSYILPITHSLEAMRMALLQGYSFQKLLPSISALAFFALIMLPVSLYVFQFAVVKAKIAGTLTQY